MRPSPQSKYFFSTILCNNNKKKLVIDKVKDRERGKKKKITLRRLHCLVAVDAVVQ